MIFKTKDPLEETLRFLKPLEKFASHELETHTLGFEVYMRKKRFLLMLKSLKKIKQIEEKQNKPKAKFHYYLCKFLIECESTNLLISFTYVCALRFSINYSHLNCFSQQEQDNVEWERSQCDQLRAQECFANRDTSQCTQWGVFEEELKQLWVCARGLKDHLWFEARRWGVPKASLGSLN